MKSSHTFAEAKEVSGARAQKIETQDADEVELRCPSDRGKMADSQMYLRNGCLARMIIGRHMARVMDGTKRRRIKAIDLFCGAGGSSWGAQAAGVEIVAAFDMWPVAESVYLDNFPDVKFYPGRIEDHDVDQIVKEVGHIDLIIASPECTNHSVAKGNKPRCEESRETALLVVKFARAFNPRWVVVENVVSMKSWSRYTELIQQMEDLGYHAITRTLNAADFGVPQARRRLFLMFDLEAQPRWGKPRRRKRKTADQIVDGNGKYLYTPLRGERRAEATLRRAERAIAHVGEHTPFLIVYYGSDHAGGWQSLDVPLRTVTTLDRFAHVKPSASGHLMRMLQPEELKAAMGWPRRFKIEHGTRRDKIKMIGNAVCPRVMQNIISSLCKKDRGF